MRKFLVFGLAVGMLFVALIVPPLTGAKKNERARKRIDQEKLSNDKAAREWNPKVQRRKNGSRPDRRPARGSRTTKRLLKSLGNRTSAAAKAAVPRRRKATWRKRIVVMRKSFAKAILT